ncbi:MAG TPA: glucosaminidase domain-containing protein [Parasegetibacter sp.]|jgi:hypothetical protein
MLGKKLICCIVLFLCFKLQAQKNPEVLIYIDQYKHLAIEEMKRSGVPASIKLAQGILETQAGKSPLVLRSNNHFGIKCKSSWTGDKVYHDDDAKGECFRSYASSEDSYRDHSDFLRTNARYASLFSLDPLDYEGWAHGLKKAGYATNPQYPQLLIKTIKEYNLNFYSEVALGKSKEDETLLAKVNLPAPADVKNQKDISLNTVNQTGYQNAGSGGNQHAGYGTIYKKESTFAQKKSSYPGGVFNINSTKVIFAPKGTSTLVLANQHNISLPRLFEFNDMQETDVLQEDQLIFLQRKRKTGHNKFHVVEEGETLHSIAQMEGIRLESLLELNHLKAGMQPASGEILYLKKTAPHQIKLTKN